MLIEPTSSIAKPASVYARTVGGQRQVLKRTNCVRCYGRTHACMKNTRIAPMRSHIDPSSQHRERSGRTGAVPPSATQWWWSRSRARGHSRRLNRFSSTTCDSSSQNAQLAPNRTFCWQVRFCLVKKKSASGKIESFSEPSVGRVRFCHVKLERL